MGLLLGSLLIKGRHCWAWCWKVKWSDLYFKTSTGGAIWGIECREAKVEAGKAEGLGWWYRQGPAPAVWQWWETFYLRIYLGERQKQDLLMD